MNIDTPQGSVRVQLDKNTVVYVREGANVEEVKEKLLNRTNKHGDYSYLFDYGTTNKSKSTKRANY